MATLRPYSKFQNLPPLQTISLLGHFRPYLLKKKYEHGFFTKVMRTSAISERHIIERHLQDNRHIKKRFILFAISNVISQRERIHCFSL